MVENLLVVGQQEVQDICDESSLVFIAQPLEEATDVPHKVQSILRILAG